ncbi:MAG: F0F1 ATP synthase subunit A [Tissierellia bacterium]|nr:F0F1 ATP synthase subunit A [Tissierellia bacterium]
MEIAIILNGKETIIPDTIISLLIIAIVLIVFALLVNSKVKKAKFEEAPSGLLNIMELFVETMDGMVKDNIGEKFISMSPFMLTLITLIAVSNLSGLFGLTPPTSDYGVTLTLALIVFLIVQISHIISVGGFFKYLKSLTKPYILMTPINIISEISNPISMSFRLFGNVLSGVLITGLLYGSLGYFAPLVTPLHIYFDIFVGLLQAFIFTMLTMTLIGSATN